MGNLARNRRDVPRKADPLGRINGMRNFRHDEGNGWYFSEDVAMFISWQSEGMFLINFRGQNILQVGQEFCKYRHVLNYLVLKIQGETVSFLTRIFINISKILFLMLKYGNAVYGDNKQIDLN